MHFFFLGPAETQATWIEIALFVTQLLVAVAAFAAPFLTHRQALKREWDMNQAADRRQRRALASTESQLARERAAKSQAVFYAIQMEAGLIRAELGIQTARIDQENVQIEELKSLAVDVPFAIGSPSLWVNLDDADRLQATTLLVNALESYNRAARSARTLSRDIMIEDIFQGLSTRAQTLQNALDTVESFPTQTPGRPFRNRLVF